MGLIESEKGAEAVSSEESDELDDEDEDSQKKKKKNRKKKVRNVLLSVQICTDNVGGSRPRYDATLLLRRSQQQFYANYFLPGD